MDKLIHIYFGPNGSKEKRGCSAQKPKKGDKELYLLRETIWIQKEKIDTVIGKYGETTVKHTL